uniref:Uncharacterized protein n=1 Tax=Rhizophora mucronata TaxID=61149 RepID=A0A2P2PYC5_RHIMU
MNLRCNASVKHHNWLKIKSATNFAA